MRRLLAAAAALAVVGAAGLAMGGAGPIIVPGSMSSLSQDLDANTNDLNDVGVIITGADTCSGDAVQYDKNGAQGCPWSTNTAPEPMIVHPQDNYPGGSQTPAVLYLRGGLDERTVAIDGADTCTNGDTVTVTVNATANVLTYGTSWCNPSCASQAARVTSLTAAIEALAGVSATETGTTVLVTPGLETHTLTLAESDATCTTFSNGSADGAVAVKSPMSVTTGSGSANSIFWDGTPGTGINFAGSRFNAAASGATRFYVDSTQATTNGAVELRTAVTSLTAATMTGATVNGNVRCAVHQYSWTNAMVTALGASTTGDISVATLPAKTMVRNAYVVITGAASGPATVTVSVGRTSASYIDYIVASDAKAAANTVYGDASGERGTNLVSYDLPSYTGTTTVYAHFISSGANLSTVTSSTGAVVLETCLIP